MGNPLRAILRRIAIILLRLLLIGYKPPHEPDVTPLTPRPREDDAP